MIKVMNILKKTLLLFVTLSLTVGVYAASRSYEVGDVLLCKKKTSSVTLFLHKMDLMKQIRSPYDSIGVTNYKNFNPSGVYQLAKGDKIILLESLRDSEIYRVALVKREKRKSKQSPYQTKQSTSVYYFVDPKSFKNLAFSEHLAD
tara:strand:+ start:177 stop:614 length:438 start_codon:yes stop_codon:yes gene_type:complete